MSVTSARFLQSLGRGLEPPTLWTQAKHLTSELSVLVAKICNAEYYFLYGATVLIKPVDLRYTCISRDYDFFSEIWLSFYIMTLQQVNLLILRNIVWDQHTNSFIHFRVNQTKNMATRGKLGIFWTLICPWWQCRILSSIWCN